MKYPTSRIAGDCCLLVLLLMVSRGSSGDADDNKRCETIVLVGGDLDAAAVVNMRGRWLVVCGECVGVGFGWSGVAKVVNLKICSKVARVLTLSALLSLMGERGGDREENGGAAGGLWLVVSAVVWPGAAGNLLRRAILLLSCL